MKVNKSYLRSQRRDMRYWKNKERQYARQKANQLRRRTAGSSSMISLSTIGFWQSAVNVAVLAIAIIVAVIV